MKENLTELHIIVRTTGSRVYTKYYCVTTHTIHMFVECFFESGYVNQEKAIENIFI